MTDFEWSCKDCLKDFTNKRNYINHINKDSCNKKKRKEEQNTCAYCGYCFTTKQSLQVHLMNNSCKKISHDIDVNKPKFKITLRKNYNTTTCNNNDNSVIGNNNDNSVIGNNNNVVNIHTTINIGSENDGLVAFGKEDIEYAMEKLGDIIRPLLDNLEYSIPRY